MDLGSVQSALRELGVDGWLFIDFRGRDFFAKEVLGLTGFKSRRWAYLIPAWGEPRKILHRIEPRNLEHLPGTVAWYSTWREWERELAGLLRGSRSVAMQYSPMNALPYLGTVDAGTVELVRAAGGAGLSVVSSAPLVARFQGRISAEQIASHEKASVLVDRVKDEAFAEIGRRARSGAPMTEREAVERIEGRFGELGIIPEGHGPNVSAGANAGNPHYDPPAEGSALIELETPVLIDLWGKMADDPQAVVYDITWCGYVGDGPLPEAYAEMFGVAMRARDAAEEVIRARYAEGAAVSGAEADDACREVVTAAGYGEWFTHRTGHAIDTRTHGSGVNLDNFETHDDRPLLPGACFSIEPGIYCPRGLPFGVRTEINLVIDWSGQVRQFGRKQRELLRV